MCSRNRTGFSSRIAAIISPFASEGVAGQTIFSPGTACSHGAGICEWMAPKRPPPPTALRITSGTVLVSADRNQCLAAWLIRLSIARGRKSPNMISTIGRSPVAALP